MTDLKPCPFCGGYNTFFDEEFYTVFVYCAACGAKGPPSLGNDINETTKKWNNRPGENNAVD